MTDKVKCTVHCTVVAREERGEERKEQSCLRGQKGKKTLLIGKKGRRLESPLNSDSKVGFFPLFFFWWEEGVSLGLGTDRSTIGLSPLLPPSLSPLKRAPLANSTAPERERERERPIY